jgi:hypothetical protein
MIRANVEYLGFSSDETARSYALQVNLPSGESQRIAVLIENEAFLTHRVRYQDAPEICFLKLQRTLAAVGDGALPERQTVTDTELAEYRCAHTPKPSTRRPPPAPHD